MTETLVPEALRTTLYRAATDLAFCTERFDREAFRRRGVDPTYRKPLHEAEREVPEPLLADGFDLVGCGIARCVLRFPATSSLSELVVKLGRFGVGPVSFGAVQNKPEALVWTRYGEGGDWPLVPVADYEQDRFSLLVMPYGEPITDRPEAKQQELLRRVRSRIRFLDSFDMRELFESNIVVVDGTPLVADYGLPDGL
jgi:hypothetical protein